MPVKRFGEDRGPPGSVTSVMLTMLRDTLFISVACFVPSALFAAVARSIWTDYGARMTSASIRPAPERSAHALGQTH